MRRLLRTLPALAGLALLACAHFEAGAPASAPFTIAVIPDTQNYVDYSHQKDAGFAFDASELFIAQMRDVARRAVGNGGDLVFVASVGDVWQHQTERIDPEHAARGFRAIDNPIFASEFKVGDEARTIEIPKAIEGYEIIAAAGLPFGVAPGNHDYDAMWSAAEFPPDLAKLKNDPAGIRMVPDDLGMFHIGGLDNFRSAFGADTDFFRGKPWYVDQYAGGANSAQTFEAGGYTFLHVAIQMQAPDDVLEWVRGVLAKHPGKPTILSTHDYLTPWAERIDGGFLDFTLVDPAYHNTPQQIFEKLIAPNDQIFLVLCGHYHGQAFLEERNEAGHAVYTVLADYQDRGQVGLDAGQPNGGGLGGGPTGIGDGWLRLLRFDTTTQPPKIAVRTYSTHYGVFSDELPEYAAWYREHEQKEMTDEAFLAEESFDVTLPDFRARFGPPRE